MTADAEGRAEYASPPCFAHELEPAFRGYAPVDRQQARDVGRWRKAERARLIALRLATSAGERRATAETVEAALDVVVQTCPGMVVSLYWPFRGELDLREWMAGVIDRGARVALPLVVAMAHPLIFREWRPGCPMKRGVWNIPAPADGEVLTPDFVLAPLVGFDPDGYRLGYGGGFFDRTLAALSPQARAIGVGQAVAAVPTIYPQPHDIPMNAIVTEVGVRLRVDG